MPFSKILSLPFVLIMALGFYLALQVNPSYAYMVVPCVLVLALIYIFSPEIDWFWYQRHPPELPEKLLAFFEKHSFFYQQLRSEDDRRLFRQRVAMFKIATDFKSPEEGTEVSEDLKVAAAASAVSLTFQGPNFLLPPFETVVVFPQAFHSPQYQRHVHTSELFEEDGVLLFSAPHLMKGFMSPKEYYDVGLHEWARAFVLCSSQLAWPTDDPQRWHDFSRISGFPAQAIQQWINRPDVELLPATIVHYFHFPQQFKAVLPEVYGQLEGIFRLEKKRA
ncbi:MAG TPA: zinc-dependent peptidase [Haliscomenobacter sp.]|uniref:zinc-dependent peptidase n=1 Tax=Haliscomenobacter sp. TaxID=2717303 RepID=UPI002CAE7DAE|nr:zinc-dependent peptidase [Haliscomenobacter sp.]HOY19378.1 zinc-dependent peptidase [Haliscomenobacter sp.]